MKDESFETMRDIGAEFGLTSHQLGKILTKKGLRNGGRPSSMAFHENWVQQRFAADLTNYMWAWSVGRTRRLLASLGHKPKDGGSPQAV